MKDLLQSVLDLAREKGATYADVRWVQRRNEPLQMKNGNVETLATFQDEGFGVRVIVDGGWGFASTPSAKREDLARTVDAAVEIAKASALCRLDGIKLAPVKPVVDRRETKVIRDPFAVPMEEKIQLLLACHEAMRAVPEVKVTQGSITIWEERKIFASSEGAYIEQKVTETGASISAHARDSHDVQRRSFSNYMNAGYEWIEEMNLVGKAATLAQEASQLLSAPECPRGETTLILGSEQVALQIHESCGHPVELDRVMGTEATYAGTSFLTPEKWGSFRYGSEVVNITADATIEEGLGGFFYDDEGVPAQRTPIITEGIFTNYLTSRETALEYGSSSNGTMRAVGWSNLPLIRMTNINLEPGNWTLAEMIRTTKEGVYMETPKSWSLDDKRLNFHFGCEIAYEIKDGKLGRMLKNPAYTAMTPVFWNSCDAVANQDEWQLWGMPSCAKGEPVQVVHVAHGASPARFQNIKVGVGE
ncbi:MAG: TldD/PmbA family protein [Bacillota bacterium]